MADLFETCRDYRVTIPLSFLKISELCDIPSRFYESLNGENRMCELGLGDITIYASRLLHRSALRYIAYCMTLDNHNL